MSARSRLPDSSQARVSGSHHWLKHPDGRTTTVPVHGNKDVPKGTFLARAIAGSPPPSFATCSDPATTAATPPWQPSRCGSTARQLTESRVRSRQRCARGERGSTPAMPRLRTRRDRPHRRRTWKSRAKPRANAGSSSATPGDVKPGSRR
ncbi:MAG: type II toxin-antitoxin system HicA family toxin [Streptosporangiaceae bacterium]